MFSIRPSVFIHRFQYNLLLLFNDFINAFPFVLPDFNTTFCYYSTISPMIDTESSSNFNTTFCYYSTRRSSLRRRDEQNISIQPFVIIQQNKLDLVRYSMDYFNTTFCYYSTPRAVPETRSRSKFQYNLLLLFNLGLWEY